MIELTEESVLVGYADDVTALMVSDVELVQLKLNNVMHRQSVNVGSRYLAGAE